MSVLNLLNGPPLKGIHAAQRPILTVLQLEIEIKHSIKEAVTITIRQAVKETATVITATHIASVACIAAVGTCLLYTSPSPRDS